MNETRILVVDDEEDLCEILKFNLENEGYEVDTANSAEEALKLDICSYQLILLDVMMGEISGFKMANMLKKDKKTAKVPIIFITAKDTYLLFRDINDERLVSKPFGNSFCFRCSRASQYSFYIWSDEVYVLDRTIDVNITRLRKKIGIYGKCIVTRLGYGYCFEA